MPLGEGEQQHHGNNSDDFARLPAYRDADEDETDFEDEYDDDEGDAEAGRYANMHPMAFPKRKSRSAKLIVAVRRWCKSSCDASLARFFVGFAVVGVVLWLWLR